MGEYRNSDYYDKLYAESVVYNVDEVQKSPYYELWKKVIQRISKKQRIADFGCGNGLFAKHCLKNCRQYEVGYDFSEFAINKAKQINPEIADRFVLADLNDSSLYKKNNYDIAVFVEVLEHIEDDLAILAHIPELTPTIITVPNYDSNSHVRIFANQKEAIDRYRQLFFIKEEEVFTIKVGKQQGSEVFLLKGEKKWDLM